MAEAIGLVASVVQLAGTGLKLSQALYQYADGVANADRRIKEVAKEIKLTSCVIEELGNIFKQDDTLSLISDSAVATANETLKECSTVFEEIETTLDKSRKGKMGRLMLPFRESKIELLRNHIDKLKSTLQLLMQVLVHAHQVASSKIDREAEARQREEIRQLLEEKKNTTKRYEESLRNFAASDSSTLGENDVSFLDDNGSASMIDIKSIGSTMNPDSLAECMQHVRTLLESMERLQQALATKSEGGDHSSHHQTTIESYFAARSHLDNILLGSSNAANLKGTVMPIRETASIEAPLPVSEVKVHGVETVDEAMVAIETSTTMSADKKKKSTYLQRLMKSRTKSVPDQVPNRAEVKPDPPPVVPVTSTFGGSGGFGSPCREALTFVGGHLSPATDWQPLGSGSAPTYSSDSTGAPPPWIPSAPPPWKSSAPPSTFEPAAYVTDPTQQKEEKIVILENMRSLRINTHGTGPKTSGESRESSHSGKANDLEAAPQGNDEVDELLREWTTCFA